jgi:hypothetical protein
VELVVEVFEELELDEDDFDNVRAAYPPAVAMITITITTTRIRLRETARFPCLKLGFKLELAELLRYLSFMLFLRGKA